MDLLIGLGLVFISGTMVGSALAPMKFMRKYHFENFWLVNVLVGTVLLPWTLALSSVPNLFNVFAGLPAKVLMVPPLFAFGWGIAKFLSGQCAFRIGLSLTYALVVGIGGSTGTLIPLIYFSPKTLASTAGFVILSGVAVMVFGLVIVAKAGRKKEAQERSQTAASRARANPRGLMQGSFLAGLAMAILAGFLSAGLNFSFVFGQDVRVAAAAAGASGTGATYAVWALAMVGGALPNLAYVFISLFRNKSWGRFAMSPHTDVPLAALMGILFITSTTLYGVGALRLGVLGTSVGWGIMQSTQIVVGNLAGFLLGEWKVAGREPTKIMFSGLGVLILACVLMAFGNYLHTAH